MRLLLVGAFMVDARFAFGAALPGDAFYRTHSCLTAYWQAAALARDGAINLYDAALYEHHTVDGFGIDAYLYPPPFLLWPTAAALLTDNFRVARVGWFVVELGLFIWAFGAVAAWVGGRPGARCLLWLPVVMTALPVLLGLQMGNFHLAAIALAMLGMVAVEEEHPRWGGFCISVAIGAKLFPAILLIVLAGRRKPTPILWTLGWLVAETAGTLVLFGVAPLKSFIAFQLPQLFHGDPAPWEAPGLFGTVNSSILGLALKIRAVGVPIGPVAASVMGWVYAVTLSIGALAAGVMHAKDKPGEAAAEARHSRGDEERLRSAQAWLAFLGLASMAAPFLPDAYAAVASLWLLALAGPARRSRRAALAVGFLVLWPVLPSRIAVPGFEHARLTFTSVAQLVLLAVAGGVAWNVGRRRNARPASSIIG